MNHTESQVKTRFWGIVGGVTYQGMPVPLHLCHGGLRGASYTGAKKKKKGFLLQDSSDTKHQHVNKVYRAVMPDMFLQACMTSQRPSPSAVDSATTSTTIHIVGNVLQLYKGLVWKPRDNLKKCIVY